MDDSTAKVAMTHMKKHPRDRVRNQLEKEREEFWIQVKKFFKSKDTRLMVRSKYTEDEERAFKRLTTQMVDIGMNLY